MCIRDSSGVRGLNAILATVTTNAAAPVIVAQRLRKGSCGSPRGAKRLVTDALATVRKLRTGPAGGKVLLRADSAFYGHGPVGAAVRAGAQVSVTVRLDPTVKAAIAAIPNDAWQTIEYTNAVFDQTSQAWISAAEVAEIHAWLVWSKTAFVYSMVCHASLGMAAMAAFTVGSSRTVTETCAPARTAAPTGPCP